MSVVEGLGDDAGWPPQPEPDWLFLNADFQLTAETLTQVQAITYPPTS